MIITYLEGGLGNLLFQICFTLALAKEHNDKYVFENRIQNDEIIKNRHGADVSNYYSTIFRNIDLDSALKIMPQIGHESHFNYFVPQYEPNCINLYKGYFQSEKFFKKHEQYIYDLLKPTDELIQKIKDKYPYLDSMNCVSIHVRRGDYLALPNHHPLLPVEYYHRALSKLGEFDKILLFTNDYQWCSNHLVDSRMVYIDEPDWVSMYIMGMCKQHVIANSSFSWWGAKFAELNFGESNVKVIKPTMWFGPAVKVDTSDMFPDRWISIV